MLSNFKIEEKKFVIADFSIGMDRILIHRNKIFYNSNYNRISVRDISKGKLLYFLKGHHSSIYQISNLQKEIHSDFDILVSYDQDGTFKFWSNSNKKCLRTLNLFCSNEFVIFRSNVIVFKKSIGLGIFSFNGKIKELKAPNEIKKWCSSMIIHRDINKNLLIYGGFEYIIIRNLDKNFEIVSKIWKIKESSNFSYFTPFYDLHYQRLELIASTFDDFVYIFEMEDFKEVKYLFDKTMKCQTNILNWKDFLIFGYVNQVIFCKIQKEGIYPVFKIEC